MKKQVSSLFIRTVYKQSNFTDTRVVKYVQVPLTVLFFPPCVCVCVCVKDLETDRQSLQSCFHLNML